MVPSEINPETLKHYLDLYFCVKKDTAILNSYTNIGHDRVCVGGDILNLKYPICKNLQNSKKNHFSTSFLVINHDFF